MEKKENSFSDTLLAILNDGALALMISIGHRTYLFDIMAEIGPSTSEQISSESNLKERYVREWLGAMVTGRIVEYDPDNGQYNLPPERASFLTRKSAPNNLAVYIQYIPLANVENRIVESFKRGRGVPYSYFTRFHEIMEEESSQTILPALIDSIIPLVSGLKERLDKGIDALDIGCGRGRALILMAQNFPRSHFVGYDFSEEAISSAKSIAEKFNLSNVSFEVIDVSNIQTTPKFDLITAFDAIHDQVKPDKVLKNIASLLRPKGIFLMQDIAASSKLHNNIEHPIGPFLYTISCMHCMTVSLANNGAGLGAVWGKEKALEMLKISGFTNVEVNQLPHDFQNYYFVSRKN